MSNIIIVICFLILIIVSLCGNCLVCRMLIRQRKLCNNSTNILIGILAVSDLMMTAFNVPFTVADIILNDWIFGNFFCILVSFVQANSVYVSSFTMAVIAIDRCNAIYKFKPKNHSNDAHHQISNANTEHRIDSEDNNNGIDFKNKINATNEQQQSINSNRRRIKLKNCSILERLNQIFRLCFGCCLAERKEPSRIRLRLQLRTRMILIISGIWIIAALHSLPHTIFNRVTVIETNKISNHNNLIVDRDGDNLNYIDSIHNSNDTIDSYREDEDEDGEFETESSIQRHRRCIPVLPNWFGPNYGLWLTLFTTATQYIIPLSCAAIIYTRIAFTISSQGKVGNMSETRAERINKHKRKRLLMLALIVAIFAFCWLPFNIYYLLLDFGVTKSYNHTAFLVCLWLATSSVCYNPFVYCWLNKNFRQEAKSVWKRFEQFFCFLHCSKERV
ncbi:thioredoxin-like protein 4A-like [Sarcoptes scabiei]|nr:thioredoxin-like protein 4A-like [Sarcoptes scabiei]